MHLAGDREPTATWASAIKHNMDATLSLYHHAAAYGVKRVILASSNWIHGDKRFTNDILNGSTDPGPNNAYGMSKLLAKGAALILPNITIFQSFAFVLDGRNGRMTISPGPIWRWAVRDRKCG